jgi:hypothetical protein
MMWNVFDLQMGSKYIHRWYIYSLSKIMRDVIKRFGIIVVYGALLAYIVYLYGVGATIVQWSYADFNALLYVLLFVFALYKFVFYGVYPVKINFSKITLFVLGMVLLFVGQYVLVNNPSQWVYIADLIKIVAVVLIVLSPTNILHTDVVMKKDKAKGVEIIEV